MSVKYAAENTNHQWNSWKGYLAISLLNRLVHVLLLGQAVQEHRNSFLSSENRIRLAVDSGAVMFESFKSLVEEFLSGGV